MEEDLSDIGEAYEQILGEIVKAHLGHTETNLQLRNLIGTSTTRQAFYQLWQDSLIEIYGIDSEGCVYVNNSMKVKPTDAGIAYIISKDL